MAFADLRHEIGRRIRNLRRSRIAGVGHDFVGDIKALQDVGVTSFDFGLFGSDAEATVGNMRKFRDDVIAKVR